jgi:hypothetical protein
MTAGRVNAFRAFLEKSKEEAEQSNPVQSENVVSTVPLASPAVIEAGTPAIASDTATNASNNTSTNYLEQALGDIEQWVDPVPDVIVEDSPVEGVANSIPNHAEPANESTDYGNDGWTQYIDDESGVPYWYNEVSGEARWIEDNSDPTQIEIQGVWEKYYDDDGNPFYFNSVSMQSF